MRTIRITQTKAVWNLDYSNAVPSGGLAHCPGPGLRVRNPDAGMILRAKEFSLGSKCFQIVMIPLGLHHSPRRQAEPGCF